jgi:hypothetical protein
MQRIFKYAVIVTLVCLVCAAQPADAQYRYGKYRYSTAEQGWFVFAEFAMANPRNADAVVATFEQVDAVGGQNLTYPILPSWGDDAAGRFGIGYSMASGSKFVATFWSFSTDQYSAGDGPAGGRMNFAIGPPIATDVPGVYEGAYGAPGYFAVTTEITARTADLAWVKELEIGESVDFEWSVGLRYAKFEETMEGSYNTGLSMGSVDYSAAKSNEGEMIGFRTGLRGSVFITSRISVGGSLAFSMLDGEVKGTSQLAEGDSIGGLPTNFAGITDDGRSGMIYDADVDVTWHSSSDRLRVSLGWEQSIWNDITTDLVRNFPGTTAPLAERDSVTFSGYKLGLFFRF